MNALDDFDGLNMPLDGVRLIEASAGTGKTFSLAGLYLRLLVEKQLQVKQILVMTFTRAATREMRERIRLRIAQAAAQAKADPATVDLGSEAAFTEGLLQASPLSRTQLAHQLSDAAQRMDEAVILTIHGYAQRAAADNAFDSRLPFDRGEEVDDGLLLHEVAEDYWRRGALDAKSGAAFRQLWPSADTLVERLQPFLQRPHLQLAGPRTAEIQQLWQQLPTLWNNQQALLREALLQAQQSKLLRRAKGSLLLAMEQSGGIEAALDGLAEQIHDSTSALPDWLNLLQELPAQFMAKGADAAAELQQLPLLQTLAQLPRLQHAVAVDEAHTQVLRLARTRKLQRRQFSFADMISMLHEAALGESGEALSAALHRSWPWALVDEFQDTDPQQYEILQRCYRGREHGGLILIGDPKQAIYGFRGGDVHAYLQAAADADARYGLRQNFRSTASYLRAVEALFRQAGDQAFLLDGISFESVSAGRGEHSSLLIDDTAQAAMGIWAPPDTEKPVHQGQAKPACQQACIDQIQILLDPTRRARIVRHTQTKSTETPLKPRDIAVLVNTNQQASAMQLALSASGIAAVCVHQQSVFASPQASDLLLVLLAAAAPSDEPRVRGALSSELLAGSLSQLIDLETDEAAWQAQIDRFAQAHETWREYGVLALVQNLLQEACTGMRRFANAERRMSNYLQIAELLGTLERQHFGMNGLLQALQQCIEQARQGHSNDEQQLRLESDAALVRVVTVHKSKGLEYPIVLLPYAPWLGTGGLPDKPPFQYHDQGRALLDLQDGEPVREAAVQEHRAEALRLLYVALTRAEICSYWPWGLFNGCQNGAMASLLHRKTVGTCKLFNAKSANPLTTELLRTDLAALANSAQGAVSLQPWPESTGLSASATAPRASELRARQDLPQPRKAWRISSFSGLLRQSQSLAQQGAEDERHGPEIEASESIDELPQLPSGSAFGNAMHDVLEMLQDAQWRHIDTLEAERLQPLLESALRHYGVALPQEDDARATLIQRLFRMIQATLCSPIQGLGPLKDLPAPARRAEMEFHFRLGTTRMSAVLSVLRRYGYALNLSDTHAGIVLNGLMHGFIDLLVEKDQCFYVIDYKTNWLGNRHSDYATPALQGAMHQHHYDLQYLIYLTALHRYLAGRLPDYNIETQLGGARYLFLRGMDVQRPGQGVFCDRPSSALILQLDRLFDGGEPA